MSSAQLTGTELNHGARSHTVGRAAVVWIIIGVLTGAFFLIEHNPEVSTLNAFTVTGDEFAAKVADGDANRRFAIPAIGLLGAVLLLRRKGWQLQGRTPLAALLAGYVGFCAASVLWSDEPALTFRHFSVFLLLCIGALGVARQITLRELCWVALGVTTILVFNSVRTEIFLGTFQPFSAEYRFSGTLHPNVQAPYCATMALSAACLATHSKRWRGLLWALCLAGATLLVLTKSRTVCGAFVAGLIVFYFFGTPLSKKIMAGATILAAGSIIIWLALIWGWDIENHAVNVALIGRQEEAGADSLSGRVPLWVSMLPYIADRPLVGHGYQTFWNPTRIENFSQTFQFTVSDGHCAYLDSALDLGLIGAGLCLAAIATGIRSAARGFLTTGDIGCSFLFALFACRTLNALLESNVALPTSLVPFIMVCGLAHLGFFWTGHTTLSGKSPRVTAS